MTIIVLADDDPDDRIFFEEALNEVDVATQLTAVGDGAELMKTLAKTVDVPPPPPHVIFLDLNMPFKNGFECLKEIRETPRLKNIPVVIFSTSSNQDSIEATYSLGANCYISKPGSHQLLKKAIETVLSLSLWDKNHQLPKKNFVLAIS